MNRIDRLTAILIHLQSKKIVTASELAERFDICKRTVYRDIRALEEAGVPIGSEPGIGYFIVENKPSIRDYFNTIASNSEVFLVRLLFDKGIIPEISQAKYYYGFIDEKEINDKVEMSFLSNSNDYIGRWIITLQDKVKILEPESLKVSVVGMVKKLQKKYLPS